MNAKLRDVLIPVGAWALNLACPLVPAFIWSALISAVLGDNISLDDILKFLQAHGVKLDPTYQMTEGQKAAENLPPGTTNTNLIIGQNAKQP